MSLPNIITIGRIFLVPFIVWLIITGDYFLAFLAFIIAGISDAADGYIAKRWNLVTELGAYLDPLADKLLLVSIYVALGISRQLPAWLVILVVSRDVLIVGGLLLSWLIGRPMAIRPLMISKANTAAQIALAAVALAVLGLELPWHLVIQVGGFVVAALTVASLAIYLRDWLRHMADGGGATA
jgi:cardiolipin synthase